MEDLSRGASGQQRPLPFPSHQPSPTKKLPFFFPPKRPNSPNLLDFSVKRLQSEEIQRSASNSYRGWIAGGGLLDLIDLKEEECRGLRRAGDVGDFLGLQPNECSGPPSLVWQKCVDYLDQYFI